MPEKNRNFMVQALLAFNICASLEVTKLAIQGLRKTLMIKTNDRECECLVSLLPIHSIVKKHLGSNSAAIIFRKIDNLRSKTFVFNF